MAGDRSFAGGLRCWGGVGVLFFFVAVAGFFFTNSDELGEESSAPVVWSALGLGGVFLLGVSFFGFGVRGAALFFLVGGAFADFSLSSPSPVATSTVAGGAFFLTGDARFFFGAGAVADSRSAAASAEDTGGSLVAFRFFGFDSVAPLVPALLTTSFAAAAGASPPVSEFLRFAGVRGNALEVALELPVGLPPPVAFLAALEGGAGVDGCFLVTADARCGGSSAFTCGV